MISAVFYRASGGAYTGFKISGHAGLADEGFDVACASVSSAVMLTANTITGMYGLEADISVKENKIILMLANDDDEKNGDRLLQGLKLHLEQIGKEFERAIKVTAVFI